MFTEFDLFKAFLYESSFNMLRSSQIFNIFRENCEFMFFIDFK